MTKQLVYSQEQLDIALLKNSNDGILRSVDNLKQDLRQSMSDIRSEIKTQSHWNLGLMIGLYVIIVTAVLSKMAGFI